MNQEERELVVKEVIERQENVQVSQINMGCRPPGEG